MKRMEKSSVVSNREYLDMDTDEEEFGRQETPEPEEEQEIEPEKPTFSDKELNKLVQYVKDFATLPGLDDQPDWPAEVIAIAKEYFRDPAKTILAIFYESGVLRARLEFPERTDRGLTYFLRSPWQIYTPDNFPTTVTFGSIGAALENSTLKFVENMYAPVAFSSNDWPAVMKNEIFSHLHQLLMCLINATYTPMGLTILYIPREALSDGENKPRVINEYPMICRKEKFREAEDNESEGLVERLESVARYWIRQVREALNGIAQPAKNSVCGTIVDEILYWQHRCSFLFWTMSYFIYENMSCIYDQLTNESVTSVIRKLEHERSTNVKQYAPLLSQVRRTLEETTSNIKYLNLFEDSVLGFDIPDGIENYSARLFSLIRFIGTESPFYHGDKNMEKLCRAFGTQVVEHLQRCVNLDVILDGDPEEGRKNVLECIECCKKVKRVYERFVRMDRSTDSPVLPLAEGTGIFNHIDTFVQRCNDLMAIADSRMIFDKSDESIALCGPRAAELGALYRDIVVSFRATLIEVKNARDDILEIVSSRWLDRISVFKDGIRKVENTVKNWINSIFEDILNVEEGVEGLHGVRIFASRIYLRDTLNDKWTQIWKIFARELESCSTMTIKSPKLVYHPSLPPYSGNAHIIRSNKMYLARQHDMLIDASDWFGDCDAQNGILKKYKDVVAAMNEKENALFRDWQKYIADESVNPESILNKPIFRHQDNKLQRIEVNMETYYLENIREADEWAILGFGTKNMFAKNCPNWKTLKLHYNEAERMCSLYNTISETDPKAERLLFPTLWEQLEDTMSLGFEETTWMSETFSTFFANCMTTIVKVQKSLETFKSVENEINYAMKQIGNTNLIDPETKSIEILQNPKGSLEQKRVRGVMEVLEKCETVLSLLLELKMTVDLNEPQALDYWKGYTANTIEKLKSTFTKCLRSTLTWALELLESDYIVESSELPEAAVRSSIIKETVGEVAKINASIFEKEFPTEEFKKLFEAIDFRTFLDNVDRDPGTLTLRARIEEYSNFMQRKL